MAAHQKQVTAAELAARLAADPAYVASREAAERERLQREAAYREAEQPLVDELRVAGFTLDSVWDLVNTAEPYPAALPILLKHLRFDYPDRVREGIARALAVPDAAFGWDEMKALYLEVESDDLQQGLAAALSAVATAEHVGEIVDLLQLPQLGQSRVILLHGLRRLRRDPRLVEAASVLADDALLGREARRMLGGK